MLKLIHVPTASANAQLRQLQERGCKIHNLFPLPLSMQVETRAMSLAAKPCGEADAVGDFNMMYGILFDDPGASLGHVGGAARAVAGLREAEDRSWRSELRRAESRCRKLESELAQLKHQTYVTNVGKVEPPMM